MSDIDWEKGTITPPAGSNTNWEKGTITPPTTALSYLGNQAKAAYYGGIRSAGATLQAPSEMSGDEPGMLANAGKSMEEYGKAGLQGVDQNAPDTGQNFATKFAGGIMRNIGGAIPLLAASTAGAETGGAAGTLAAPLAGPLAPFAPVAGAVIGGAIGGGGQAKLESWHDSYHQALDELKAKNDPDAETKARSYADSSSNVAGAGMAAFSGVTGAVGKVGGAIVGAATKAAMTPAEAAADVTGKSLLGESAKGAAEMLAANQIVGAGSAAAQAGINREQGIGSQETPTQAVISSAGQTLESGAAFLPFVLHGAFRVVGQSKATARALDNPDTPDNGRLLAMQQVAHAVGKVDPDASTNFKDYAKDAIANDQPITLHPDNFTTDWKTAQDARNHVAQDATAQNAGVDQATQQDQPANSTQSAPGTPADTSQSELDQLRQAQAAQAGQSTAEVPPTAQLPEAVQPVEQGAVKAPTPITDGLANGTIPDGALVRAAAIGENNGANMAAKTGIGQTLLKFRDGEHQVRQQSPQEKIDVTQADQTKQTETQRATEAPPAGAVENFQTPRDVQLQEHADQMKKSGVEEGLSPAQITNMIGKNPPQQYMDHVTGFYLDNVKAPTVERAQKYIEKTGQTAHYVDSDVANLGGVNSHSGNNHEKANVILRGLSDIFADEMNKAGSSKATLYRTKGDEFGAVIIGGTDASVQKAMDNVRSRASSFAKEKGVDKITHAKTGVENYGTGIHLGAARIVPGEELSKIFDDASAGVDESKKGAYHVSGNESETVWSGASAGESGRIRQGHSEAERKAAPGSGNAKSSVGRGNEATQDRAVPPSTAASPVDIEAHGAAFTKAQPDIKTDIPSVVKPLADKLAITKAPDEARAKMVYNAAKVAAANVAQGKVEPDAKVFKKFADNLRGMFGGKYAAEADQIMAVGDAIKSAEPSKEKAAPKAPLTAEERATKDALIAKAKRMGVNTIAKTNGQIIEAIAAHHARVEAESGADAETAKRLKVDERAAAVADFANKSLSESEVADIEDAVYKQHRGADDETILKATEAAFKKAINDKEKQYAESAHNDGKDETAGAATDNPQGSATDGGENHGEAQSAGEVIRVGESSKDAAKPIGDIFSQPPQSTLTFGREVAREGTIGMTPVAGSGENTLKMFDQSQSSSRETRTIITGNLLAGYGKFKSGQITHFTDSEGAMRQGILMPAKFDLKAAMNSGPVVFTPDQAARFLGEASGRLIATDDGMLKITSRGNGDYVVSTPSSKADGGQYFLNRKLTDAAGGDFNKVGNAMRAEVDGAGLKRVLTVLHEMEKSVGTESFREEAKKIIGIKDDTDKGVAMFSRTDQGTTDHTPTTIAKVLHDHFGGITDKLIARGDEGKKGGLVIAKDAQDLQRLFKDKTGRELGDDVLQSIAWHGSPHLFDKFASDAIGTGEGAQAYGHGLYLAEKQGVAQSYADNLGKGLLLPFRKANKNIADAEAAAKIMFPDNPELVQSAKYAYQFSTPEKASEYLAKYGNKDFPLVTQETLNQVNPLINGTPNLYKTDIPDAHIDKMLDWDKPLSEQHPDVQAAIMAHPEMAKIINADLGTMNQARKATGLPMQSTSDMPIGSLLKQSGDAIGGQTAVSDYLRQSGIPGIKYLDGSSRTAGEGTRNFVIFDPEHIRILERNGQPTGEKPWDIKFSKDGHVQGLYDPKSGLSFLIANHLDEHTAPGVLAHEILHGTDTPELRKQASDLIGLRDSKMIPVAMRDFLSSVNERMKTAKVEGDQKEAASYIVEQAMLLGKQDGFSAIDGTLFAHLTDKLGKRVGDFVRDWVAKIRAALFNRGAAMKLTVDDMTALAHAGMKQAERGEVNSGDGVMSRSDQQDRFYSQLARAISNAPDKVFTTGKQAALWLQGNAAKLGVKADELHFSGVLDYLNMQGKITKQDVLSHLDSGGVKVDTKMLGDAARTERRSYLEGLNNSGKMTKAEFKELVELRKNEDTDKTKYSGYTVPNGTDYKEMLLTLPSEYDKVQKMKMALNDEAEKLPPYEYRTPEQQAQYEELGRKFDALPSVDYSTNFQSSHFNESNILAHTRFDTFTRPDGGKTLRVMEVQSDFGQQGKKQGFGTVEEERKKLADIEKQIAVARQRNSGGEYRVESFTPSSGKEEHWVVVGEGREANYSGGKFQTKEVATAKAQELNKVSNPDTKALYAERDRIEHKIATGGMVPPAPFVQDTKSWVALAMKHIISHAIDTGHDKVVIINGEQAGDLYDLSKQVSRVHISRPQDGTFAVYAYKEKSDTVPVMQTKAETETELADIIGKDLASKVVNQPIGTRRDYTGLDLKVGASGMKGFYDGIVKQVINSKEVLGKLGGDKMHAVDSAEVGMDKSNNGMKYQDQSNMEFDITPAMRAKVQGEGIPLFSKSATSKLVKQDDVRPEVKTGIAGFMDKAKSAMDSIKTGIGELKDSFASTPAYDDKTKIVGEYTGNLQMIDHELAKFAKKINAEIPKDKQVAITNYMQAGGDMALLKQRAADSKPQFRKGYQDAMNLTDKEKAKAKEIQDTQDKFWKQANEAGILEGYVTNYVRGQWDRETPEGKKIIALVNSGMLNDKPKEAMQKVFQSYFDGEKAGFVPTDKRIGYQFVAAQRSIREAIAARKALTDLMHSKEADGRPTVSVGGGGRALESENADVIAARKEVDAAKAALAKDPTNKSLDTAVDAALDKMNAARRKDEKDFENKPFFVKPNTKGDDARDYKSLDHPSMRSWKWVGTDTAGSPILMQGNMYIHPDAYGKINALLGKSKIRTYAVPDSVPLIGGTRPGDAMLKAGAYIKATMLSGTPFHQFHVGEHAVFHGVNPMNTPELDFDRTVSLNGKDYKILQEGVNHGMMVYNHNAMAEFGEGLGGGGGLLHQIPVIGDGIQRYGEYLFQDYIPRLKAAMFEKAVLRDVEHSKDDLAANKITMDQIFQRQAKHSNDAFGEQNYKYMGRNPTIQDAMRLLLLAPDFLESRLKFAGSALTPGGREQRIALIKGALIMGIGAQIVNLMFGDDHKTHWDRPFSAIIGGREYSPRSVVGDIAHAIEDPRGFWYNRLNPLWTKPAMELASGRNANGQKESLEDGIKNSIGSWAPLPAQSVTKPAQGQTTAQQVYGALLGSIGVTNKQAKTPAEKEISDISFNNMKMAAELPGAKKRYEEYSSLKEAYMNGDLPTIMAVAAKARADGIVISQNQLRQIKLSKDAETSPLAKTQLLEHKMGNFKLEEIMSVWGKMSDDEKPLYRQFMLRNIVHDRTMPIEDKKDAIAALRQQ